MVKGKKIREEKRRERRRDEADLEAKQISEENDRLQSMSVSEIIEELRLESVIDHRLALVLDRLDDATENGGGHD